MITNNQRPKVGPFSCNLTYKNYQRATTQSYFDGRDKIDNHAQDKFNYDQRAIMDSDLLCP